MTKILQSLIFLVLLSGCSSYKALKHFNKSDSYTKAVQQSKKADLIVDNDVVTIFYATYLNKVLDRFDNNSYNFVIGFYSQNETLDDYELSLNTNKYTKIQKIQKSNDLYSLLSVKNAWAKYYIVSFDKTDADTLNLRLFSTKYGFTSISFRD